MLTTKLGVLDTFTNLTTHPVFRTYITKVVYDCSWIDPATVAKHAGGKCGSELVYLFEEQETLQANELRTRMENAFACLSNVKKVSYADLSRISFLPGDLNDAAWGCDYLDGPLIRRLESDADLDPDDMSICCLTADQTAGCPHHDDGFQYRRKFGGLTLLLQILSDRASTNLLELSLGNGAHSCGTCEDGGIPDWLLWSGTNITTPFPFMNIFRNLRKLELGVSLFTEQRGEHGNSANLAKLLGPAEKLEELKIIGNIKGEMARFTDCLATYTWARLRVVSLGGFLASARNLEDFLRRHSRTIENVTLENVCLTSGSWLEFATIVPAVAPNLEFVLGYVWEQNCPVPSLPPLDSRHLAVSGPKHMRYAKTKTYENDRDDGGQDEIEEDDEDDGSSSEELEYSSDDSSPETDEPRRGSDNALLDMFEPELRSRIEQLRSEFPRCPIQECMNALVGTRDINSLQSHPEVKKHRAARRDLIKQYGYNILDTMDPDTRMTVKRLIEDVSLDSNVAEYIDAFLSSGMDYDEALEDLRWRFRCRRKVLPEW